VIKELEDSSKKGAKKVDCVKCLKLEVEVEGKMHKIEKLEADLLKMTQDYEKKLQGKDQDSRDKQSVIE
jgi:hypothetical protein